MTEVPTAAPAQQAEETDAEKIVRAQFIIDALRRRLTDATEEAVGMESRIAMLESQLSQEQTIRLSMASEISRLRGLLPEEAEEVDHADA